MSLVQKPNKSQDFLILHVCTCDSPRADMMNFTKFNNRVRQTRDSVI